MSDKAIPVYAFDPDEDEIRFGDQLENGMLVLQEAPGLRVLKDQSRESRSRAQQFREVMQFATQQQDGIRFIGVWPDGHQEGYVAVTETSWIVKRASVPLQDEETDEGSLSSGHWYPVKALTPAAWKVMRASGDQQVAGMQGRKAVELAMAEGTLEDLASLVPGAFPFPDEVPAPGDLTDADWANVARVLDRSPASYGMLNELWDAAGKALDR